MVCTGHMTQSLSIYTRGQFQLDFHPLAEVPIKLALAALRCLINHFRDGVEFSLSSWVAAARSNVTKRHNNCTTTGTLKQAWRESKRTIADGISIKWFLIFHTVWPSLQLFVKKELWCDWWNKKKKDSFRWSVHACLFYQHGLLLQTSGGIPRANSGSNSPVFR